MPKFKVGQEVRCIGKSTCTAAKGVGWELNKAFIIHNIADGGSVCYFPKAGLGVYEDYLEEVEMENYLCLEGKKIELSEETLSNIRGQIKEEVIMVPEEIEFEICGGYLGLKFNGDRCLYYCKGFCVANFSPSNKGQCKLTPCKREDLKPGDWAFASDVERPHFKYKNNYKLIIDNVDHRYMPNEKDVCLGCVFYKHWRKVEKV